MVEAAQPAPVVEPAAAAAPTVPAAIPEPKVETKDIGTWKYTPWKGVDMWTHKSGKTSFDPVYVRKLRKMI